MELNLGLYTFKLKSYIVSKTSFCVLGPAFLENTNMQIWPFTSD